jgi:hypothetical protein
VSGQEPGRFAINRARSFQRHTVCEIRTNLELTNLASYGEVVCALKVIYPEGLVQGKDGNFYGTTHEQRKTAERTATDKYISWFRNSSVASHCKQNRRPDRFFRPTALNLQLR